MEATATRTGGWWAVEAPSIPGLFTQARRLDQIPDLIVEAAALLGHDVDAADVQVRPALSDDDRELLTRTLEARRAARAAESEASRASRELVARLRAEGFTVRDVAAVVGISPQRVSALAA